MRLLHISEMFAAILPFVALTGCPDMPGRGAAAACVLNVRIRGIAPGVEAVEIEAGARQKRVVLSTPASGRNVVLDDMPPGRVTVVVRGMRGSETVQMTTVEVVVREWVVSILSVDLGFQSGGVDGGLPVPDAGAGIHSDWITLSFDGRRDFSFGAPGLLRASRPGDPTGAYRAFLERAEPRVPDSSIGISRVEMRFSGPDDLALEDIYRGFSLLIEGVSTSTLASHPASAASTDWFLLQPAGDISAAQADLRSGDFRVALAGRTSLERAVFDGVLDARMIFDVR